jgi:hypothetical protein
MKLHLYVGRGWGFACSAAMRPGPSLSRDLPSASTVCLFSFFGLPFFSLIVGRKVTNYKPNIGKDFQTTPT